MPGGGPAGTILGMFLFVILINPIGFSQPENIGKVITNSLRSRKSIQTCHMKFIDDLTVAESISLREQLVNEERDLAFPLNYHNRTGHFLPQKLVQNAIHA